MRQLWSVGLAGILAACPGSHTSRTVAAPPMPVLRFHITDLGTLPGGTYSAAYSINNQGQVVGLSDNGKTLVSDRLLDTRAVLWEKGKVEDLIGPSQMTPCALRINDRGDVLIKPQYIGNPKSQGGVPPPNPYVVLWEKGKMTLFRGEHGGFQPVNLNNRGDLVGSDQRAGQRAILWKRGRSILLPRPQGAVASWAECINDHGQTGGTLKKRGGVEGAFFFESGKLVDVAPRAREFYTGLRAINQRGQAVGAARLSSNGDVHAFLWSNGKLTDLASPGRGACIPEAINSHGDIVAMSNSSPLLWRGGQWTDLNTVLPRDSGWELADVKDINDQGQIVGQGKLKGQWRAYLLTPLRP